MRLARLKHASASSVVAVDGQGFGSISNAWPLAIKQVMPLGAVMVIVHVLLSSDAKTSITELFAPSPMDWRVSPYPSASRVTT